MKSSKHLFTTSGFTLVELLVSVGIFTSVVIVAMMALLNVKSLQVKGTAIRTINNNVNYAVEIMSREIRTGIKYCENSCSASSFNFTNDVGVPVKYELSNGVIFRSENNGSAIAITAPEVTINNLTFVVSGTALNDNIQPRVTIVVQAESNNTKANLSSRLDIQTTITQRKLDS